MTELLNAAWGGFLVGFKFAGIVGGLIIGMCVVLVLTVLIMELLCQGFWKEDKK